MAKQLLPGKNILFKCHIIMAPTQKLHGDPSSWIKMDAHPPPALQCSTFQLGLNLISKGKKQGIAIEKMRFQFTSLLTVVSATLALASPAGQVSSGLGARDNTPGSVRPVVTCSPKTPRLPLPVHPKRTKTCHVRYNQHRPEADDSAYVLDAMTRCNNGGHVIFDAGVTYNIATALDLTFLQHVDIDIQGEILFSNDTNYWQAHSFKFIFQNATSFWQIGGEDVFIYGGGTINGNGQVWYDLYAANIYALRPVLMGINGLHDSTITNLKLRYSPQYYHFVANSTNVIFDSLDIAGGSVSKNVAKNTDGWDTYRSSDLVIQNCHVVNGDDCVAFKPNSTNLLVQNMFCNGSHGISVGSLGQYPGEYDIVENVYVYNTSMHAASDGARIKVWPNAPSELSGDLQGGGGAGRVNNITYDTFLIDSVDYAIEVDQCYGQSNITLCNEFPSPLTITNIVFNNFVGTTSKKYAPEIAAFACSSPAVCSAISATNINVVSPSGGNQAYCQNVDASDLDVTCSTVLKGFN